MAISANGKDYPLLSEAVAGGLFHPNCRHSMSVWIEGISKMPEPLDSEKVRRQAALEQHQRQLERKVRQLKRLKDGSLTPENVKAYGKQLKEAQKELRAFIDEHPGVLRYKPAKVKTYGTHGEQRTAADLTTPGSGAILNDKGDIYRPVDVEAIKKLPPIEVDGFTPERNEALTKARDELLDEVSKHPVGTEAAINLDTNMNPIGEMVVGQPGGGSVKLDNPGEYHYSLHNHPSCETFSLEDMMKFVKTDNMLGEAVIGNDGSMYLLQKTTAADLKKLSGYAIEKANQKIIGEYSYVDISNGKADAAQFDREELKISLRKLSRDLLEEAQKDGCIYVEKT